MNLKCQLIKHLTTSNGKKETWLHKEAALAYAQWVDPAFAIWCIVKF
jgi:hypothetical protein